MTDPTPPPVMSNWTPPPVAYGYAYPPVKPTNGLAIASMVVSIIAMVALTCYGVGGLVMGPIGAILGHVSRRKIKERDQQGEGMALAGIIIGWIATGLGLLIVAAVAFFFVWAVNSAPQTPNEW